ncbi:hypothetical protein BDV12DRAFT_167789 [Aspergillus spectabilis]
MRLFHQFRGQAQPLVRLVLAQHLPAGSGAHAPLQRRAYSVALVGLGYRGYRSHFLSLINSPSVSITAVCDTNRTSLELFSAKHRHIPTYSSLPQLLSSHRPDFAIVSVPHGAHMNCIFALAAKGVSVLKEKPVAESVEEYKLMNELPIKVGVTFQKRFEPQFLHLKSLLPLVGDIAAIEATLALNITNLEETWRATSGVGVTEDLGCHMIDLLVWLFGPPTSLMAQTASSVRPFQNYGGDDISDIMLEWRPNRFIGHVRLSRVSHRSAQTITVTGTNGTLILDGHEITHYDPQGHQTLKVKHQAMEKLVLQSMIHQFGDWVTGQKPGFSTSLANVRDTVAVVDAIQTSLTRREVQHPLLLSSRARSAPVSNQLSCKSTGQGSIAAFSTSSRHENTERAFPLNTGFSIPAVGLGTRGAQRSGEVCDAVHVALKTGYRMIDTAQSSGNEHEIGQAIKDSGVPRSEIWVTTKLHNRWHTRVGEAVALSLRALDLEYIDLFLMHWPVPISPDDSNTQLGDWAFVKTWQEMQRLPSAKVRNIGVSNFGIRHLQILLNHPSCKVIPAVNQIELHPYWPSRNLLAYCSDHGIHCTAYSCLGSLDSPLLQDPIVLDISRKANKSPQQILLKWSIQRGTSVIPKSVNATRIQDNFELGGWSLTGDEMDRIDSCKTRFKSCRDDWLPVKVFDGDEY